MNDTELDRALGRWATSDPVGAGDSAAVERMIRYGTHISAARPSGRGWFHSRAGRVGGGAVAASLMVAIVGMTIQHQTAPVRLDTPLSATLSAGEQAAGDELTELEIFALLHVPTDDEKEILI